MDAIDEALSQKDSIDQALAQKDATDSALQHKDAIDQALQQKDSQPAPITANKRNVGPINSDELPTQAPFTGPEPLKSPLAEAIHVSPLGVAAGGVKIGMNALGAGSEALGNAYDWAVGKPTAATQAIANAPKTVIEKATQVEQVPETLLKKGALALEGANNPTLSGLVTGKQPDVESTWENVVRNFPGFHLLPKDAQDEIAKDLGVIGEPTLDPMWFLKPLGVTAEGEKALKAGMLEPNLGNASQAGQRALLTAGGKPIIQGAPIMDALGKVQTGLREQFPGFHTGTENPTANAIIEKQKAAEGYGGHLADIQGAQDKQLIERHAAMMDITPEELQQTMREYREPAMSQDLTKTPMGPAFAEGYGPAFPDTKEAAIEAQRQEIAKGLPPEVVDRLNEQIDQNKQYVVSEKLPNERLAYLKRSSTPEWQEFKDKTFAESENPKGAGKPGNVSNPAEISRMSEDEIDKTLSNHTMNEVNNLSEAGKLGTIMPRFPELFNNFRGKIFDDDLVRTEAQRYLNNVKVTSKQDMVDALTKTFSKSTESLQKIVGGDGNKMMDWVEFPGKGSNQWMPKQIGNYLKGIENPEMAQFNRSLASQFLKSTTGATKLVQFGWYPKSALFNYLSNLNMAGLNKMLSPKNTSKALDIVKNERVGLLGDKEVLKSPIYGNITEKQLVDQAYKQRGIGMGIYRSEMASPNVSDWMRNNKYSKFSGALHNYAEDASRLPVFMTALENGYTWEGAAKAARDSLYDYSNVGATDKKLATLIPFYRFARMNTPKMIERMITDPARTFAVEKTREAWNKSQGQQQNNDIQNEYRRGSEPWSLGKDSAGKPLWVAAGRFFTQNDLNNILAHPLDYVASALNPAVKVPLEIAANYDWSYHRPIEQFKGQKSEVLPGVNLPAKLAYALNNLRPLSEIRQATNQNVPLALRAIRSALGFNIYSQDVGKDKAYQQYERSKELSDLGYQARLQGRLRAEASQSGDKNAEELARENLIQAILDRKDAAQRR